MSDLDHHIADLFGRRQHGSSGVWYLETDERDRTGRVASNAVVRQNPRYEPGNTINRYGDGGAFEGRSQYPRRPHQGTQESRGYPMRDDWMSRRGAAAPYYQTVPLAVRGYEYGPRDFDWFHDQHQQGLYTRDGGRGQSHYEPREGAPRGTTWRDDHWFDTRSRKPYRPDYTGPRYDEPL